MEKTNLTSLIIIIIPDVVGEFIVTLLYCGS